MSEEQNPGGPEDPPERGPTPRHEPESQSLPQGQASSPSSPASRVAGAPATVAIIGLNFLVFAAMVFLTGAKTLTAPSAATLLAWGADYGPYTMNGEPWRLFTAMFLHIGMVVGAGASGAIFGALGGLLAFATLRKMIEPSEVLNQLQSSAIKCIVINFLISLSIRGIDSSAHLGGLVFGMIAGAVYLRGPIRGVAVAERTRVVAGTIAIIGLLIVIGVAAAYRARGMLI